MRVLALVTIVALLPHAERPLSAQSFRYFVTGRLIDPQGRAPRAFEVEYGSATGSHRGLLVVREGDGRFAIDDGRLQTGPLTLFARAEIDGRALVAVANVDLGDRPAHVDLALGRAGIVRGRVVRAAGVAATPGGLRLALAHAGFAPVGVPERVLIDTTADGSFTAEGVLGDYRIEVLNPPGWIATSDRVRVFQDQTIDLQVGLAQLQK